MTTLEENAGNESETEEGTNVVHVHVFILTLSLSLSLSDLPVTHLQLLLLVWGSFTEPVRKGLLLQCVGIINKVAEERE